MSVPYISTATVGSAHESDILGVCVTPKFTITCSSDGYLKLWNNNNSDRTLHSKMLVDKVGLHHVEALVEVIDMKKVLLIATVSFSGKIYIYRFDYESDELKRVRFDPAESGLTKKTAFLSPVFDTTAGLIIFACTTVSGKAIIFDLTVEDDEINFVLRGELFANDTSFATCICSDINHNRLVVGHQNGNAYMYDFRQLILTYTFESFGLKNSKSLNIVRDVKFSPQNGEWLAIAHDSGPHGTISLYDVKYGEYLGSFTVATHSTNVGIGNFAHSKWCFSISFNNQGDKLVSCGLDNTIRVWDVDSRTCLKTLRLNTTDLDDEEVSKLNDLDSSACTSVRFVPHGIFPEDGQNDGLVAVGFDRSIRWFREAGGI